MQAGPPAATGAPDPDADPRSVGDHRRIAQAGQRDHAEVRPVGRDRGRLRRGRRHGRVPARDGRHQGAAARSRADDRRRRRNTGRWSGRTSRCGGIACRPTNARSHVAEYNFVDRPYGNDPKFAKYKKLTSYAGNAFTRNWVVNEKEHPTTGTPYAWVRARVLGGKTNFWGRGALRYGPHAVQGGEPRRLRRRLADRLRGRRAVLRQGRSAARLLGHDGRPRAGAGRRLPAADQAQLRRGVVQARDREDGPALHSGPRRRHHRRRAEQQVPHQVHGARPLRPRLRSATPPSIRRRR